MAECCGKILSLMEQAPAFEIKIGRDGSIRTALIKVSLNDQLPKNKPHSGGTFSAHGKTCPKTGDRIHVSYSSTANPFFRVLIFEEGCKLKRAIDVDDLPCPVKIHVCAITENYAVVLDFPLLFLANRMLRNIFPLENESQLTSY